MLLDVDIDPLQIDKGEEGKGKPNERSAVKAHAKGQPWKAVQKDMRIEHIRLLSKSGGKGGDYHLEE